MDRPDGIAYSAADGVRFWSVVIVVTIVASIFEIGFLYWDALRSVHAMASAAGLKLAESDLTGERRDVALALARAALELPNPPHRTFGVDPRRESSPLACRARGAALQGEDRAHDVSHQGDAAGAPRSRHGTSLSSSS